MNTHPFLDDDLRDRAAAHVLGSDDDAEARAYRLHLGGCATCRYEVEALQIAARELAWLAPEVPPPARTFERVLALIRASARASSAPDPHSETETPHASADLPVPVWKLWREETPSSDAERSFHYVGAGDGEWEPTGFPGVEARRLSVDRARDRVTFLARMAPGTAYPAHLHRGAEECYVLQGDLRVGDLHMHAGDYQRADEGSFHGIQSTDEGCLLLIVSSLGDEIVG